MEITREVALVTAEESDQCTVTLAIGTTAIDLSVDEAWLLGNALNKLAISAETHEAEQQQIDAERVAAQPEYGFDVEGEDA